jgi:hypothetical protein
MSNEAGQSGPSPVANELSSGLGAASLGALAIGAVAIGLLARSSQRSNEASARSRLPQTANMLALALGAASLGALAIGAVAIGRLAIGKARLRELEIDELTIRRLHVLERDWPTARP